MVGVSLPFATTAADVSLGGRVANANGCGISGVRVLLNDGAGHIMSATTNPFGYYRFDGIEAGHTVLVSISSKRYRFANPVQLITIGENAFDVNFVANN